MTPRSVPRASGALDVDTATRPPGTAVGRACDHDDDARGDHDDDARMIMHAGHYLVMVNRPPGEKWVPNPENLVKHGQMLNAKSLKGLDDVVVYLGKFVYAAPRCDAHGLAD